MKRFKYLVFIVCLLLAACAQTPNDNKVVAADPDSGGLERLGKSDIDEVVELHQRAVMANLKRLMIELYQRNPNQRHDKKARAIEQSANLMFSMPLAQLHPLWTHKSGADIIRLAFDETYKGDRVFAYIVGLRKMIMAAYGNYTEFYYFTSLSEQKLYNSARNIEIAAWMLAHKKKRTGELFILSDNVEPRRRNLSFQRVIGKMIATQDNLANIIDHKEGRIIRTTVVRSATLVFFPI